MRKVLPLIAWSFAILPLAGLDVQATDLSIKFLNRTGQVVSGLTAVPASGEPAIEIFAGTIAAAPQAMLPPPTSSQTQVMGPSPLPAPPPPPSTTGQTATSFTVPDGACVFTLSYTLGSGQIVNLSDVDLCQTEQVVLE